MSCDCCVLLLEALVIHLFYLQTVRFKNELERNITIKLGYANAKIYKCEDERCPRPMCYKYVSVCLIHDLHDQIKCGF